MLSCSIVCKWLHWLKLTELGATAPQISNQAVYIALKTEVNQGVIVAALFANGSNLHAAIHQYLSGCAEEQLSLVPANDGHWQSIQPVLNDITDVVCMETFIRHPHLQYCGVLDCVAEYRSVFHYSLCIICHFLAAYRVPMPPCKLWKVVEFLLNFQRPGKS